MANQDLVDYIKSQSSNGVSSEDIKKTLVDTGWQESDVDEAMSAVAADTPAQHAQPAPLEQPAAQPMQQPMQEAATPGQPQDMLAGMAEQPGQQPGIMMGAPGGSPMDPLPQDPTMPMGGAPMQQPSMMMGGQPDSPLQPTGGFDQQLQEAGQTEGGNKKRIIIIVLVVVIVGALVAGGWYLYGYYSGSSSDTAPEADPVTGVQPTDATNTNPIENSNQAVNTSPATNAPAVNDTPGEDTPDLPEPTPDDENTGDENTEDPIDEINAAVNENTNTDNPCTIGTVTVPGSDGTLCGAPDDGEVDLNTIDSDGDGLSDAEEATYGTDPKDPDSDGDSFEDGEEVDNGYDPNGPGKLEGLEK